MSATTVISVKVRTACGSRQVLATLATRPIPQAVLTLVALNRTLLLLSRDSRARPLKIAHAVVDVPIIRL
ncbi:MAG: hypothetical protein H0U54_07730 [Acidobacteria bacterium]|nr:hypothetical protein [Acidobacteriota bacterium]